MRIHLVIIDPLGDFMDLPGAALPVPGADEDMKRVAVMIDRIGRKLEDIHVLVDSHHTMDYRHPGPWKNQNNENPVPITQGGGLISSDDIKNGIWTPMGALLRPAVLEGKTVKEFMIICAEAREKKGIPGLEIWPEHCLIGTTGCIVHPELRDSLTRWERQESACVDFIVKGVDVYTEHYGGLQAEVVIPADPSTALNSDFLNIMSEADIVLLAGEASSHCVKETVQQIADNIGEEQIKKFHILTDCTSPVPAVPNGPDFPKIAEDFMKEMEARGMTLTTSTEFLA